MAKRAPILPDNYNPVGERLKRITEPPPSFLPFTEKIVDLPLPEQNESKAAATSEKAAIPEVPTDKEIKDVSVRFRCTPSERKKWHEGTRVICGDHNNLSHFIRAAMLLIENSHEDLKRLAPDIQRLRKPATNDQLAIVLYEQRLAQILYDAIKSSGRPRW